MALCRNLGYHLSCSYTDKPVDGVSQGNCLAQLHAALDYSSQHGLRQRSAHAQCGKFLISTQFVIEERRGLNSGDTTMSSMAAASCETAAPANTEEKKPLKPCCACPETKKARDACIIENGEENCQHLIEAHKECMRSLGFKV
ncbi:cytochrome c oxidase copper chaperone [Hyperolius riggenbachi]|uniref:cytochrome c oxidase copper chaperone n=1 Tax=Hyperolius riggenbachi TaxID=752182 RepID=UPI0035A29B4F